jgi:hypothetical protein
MARRRASGCAVVMVAVLATAAVARADGEVPLEVELGNTVELKVYSARGWFCDDPTLVQAELVTRDDTNVWRVSGAKLGSTLCRVGTNPALLHYVFAVKVVEPKKPR